MTVDEKSGLVVEDIEMNEAGGFAVVHAPAAGLMQWEGEEVVSRSYKTGSAGTRLIWIERREPADESVDRDCDRASVEFRLTTMHGSVWTATADATLSDQATKELGA